MPPKQAQSIDAQAFISGLEHSIRSSQPDAVVDPVTLKVAYKRSFTVTVDSTGRRPNQTETLSALATAVAAQDCPARSLAPDSNCTVSASWDDDEAPATPVAAGRRRAQSAASSEFRSGIVTIERDVRSGPLVPPPLNASAVAAVAAALGMTNASALTVGESEGVRVRAEVMVSQPASAPLWVEDLAAITGALATELGLPVGSLTAIAYAPPFSPPQPPAAPPSSPSSNGFGGPAAIGIGVGAAVAALGLVALSLSRRSANPAGNKKTLYDYMRQRPPASVRLRSPTPWCTRFFAASHTTVRVPPAPAQGVWA